MSLNPKFAGIADLDVRPSDCFTVYEALAASVRTSYGNLAAVLDKLQGAPGQRLRDVLDVAPQVLTTAAGYCWLNAVYGAIARDSREGLDGLLSQFTRFEAAAAVSASTDFAGDFPFGEAVSLPGCGIVVVASGGRLAVTSGTPEAEQWSMPTVAGLRLDGFEPLLRNPRSMSQFGIAPGSREASTVGAGELVAASDLAACVAPTLFDRYLTEVVPLDPEPGIAHAGTDDAAPWAVYLSFGREPADLLAALAHEESHALVQTLAKLAPGLLPDSESDIPVPWKPGVRRTLSGVLHGLIAFGRAATVRARVARTGADSPANTEALEREHGWISDVTRDLLKGRLGELPGGLPDWLESNLRAVCAPTPAPATGLHLLARDGAAPDELQWLLLAGPDVDAAADRLFAPVVRSRWERGVPGFPDQDRGELDASAPGFLTDAVPALVAERTGAKIELSSVKVHRLRTGDRIMPHTDSHHEDLSHRVVLGLTPHDLRSGELRLLTPQQDSVIGTQPQFGQGLLFDATGPAYHEVTANLSPYPRYTVIASYRTVT